MELTVNKEGKVYFQLFEQGHPVDFLKCIRDMKENEIDGISVRFSPDPLIFTEAMQEEGGLILNVEYIKEQLNFNSFVSKNIKFILTEENGTVTQYYPKNSILELLKEQEKVISTSIKKE